MRNCWRVAALGRLRNTALAPEVANTHVGTRYAETSTLGKPGYPRMQPPGHGYQAWCPQAGRAWGYALDLSTALEAASQRIGRELRDAPPERTGRTRQKAPDGESWYRLAATLNSARF